jgi:hypothetical protein
MTSPDLPSREITFGSPSTITLTRSGQQATATFAGIAGHKLGVLVADNSFAQGSYRLDAEGADRPGFPEPIQATLPSGTIDMRDTQYSIHFDVFGPATGSITLTLVDVVDVTTPVVLGTDMTATFDTPWTRLAMPFTEVPNAHLRVDILSSTLSHADGTPSSATVAAGDSSSWNVDQLGSFGAGATTLYDDRIMTTPAASILQLQPDGQSTGSVQFRVTAVPETPAVPATLGVSTVVSLSTPWQSRSFSFPATTGQRFTATVTDTNLTSTSGYPSYALQLVAPDGGVTTVGPDFTVPGPAGTWVLRIDPSMDTTGTFTMTLATNPVVQVPVVIGRTATGRATLPNSIIYFNAKGSAGSPSPMVIIKSMSMVDATGALPQVGLQFEQNGVALGPVTTLTPNTPLNYSFQAPAELDPGKPWSLAVQPGQTTTGSIGVTVLRPMTTRATVSPGSTTSVTLRGVGDVTELTLAVPAGRKLVVDAAATPPYVTADFLAADGTPLGSHVLPSFAVSSTLTKSGRVTLRLQLGSENHYGATFPVKVLVVADPVYKLDGPTRISWTLGQNPRLTFKGQAGRRLTFSFTKTSWTPPTAAVYAWLTDPAGNDMYVQFGCLSGSTCFSEGPALTSGTYTLTIGPELGSAGSFVAVVGQITDITRTITPGVMTTINFAQPGQNAALKIALPATSGMSWTADSALAGTMTLLDSNGMMVGIQALPTGPSTGSFELWQSLPGGVYTMKVDPQEAQVGTVKLTLTPSP